MLPVLSVDKVIIRKSRRTDGYIVSGYMVDFKPSIKLASVFVPNRDAAERVKQKLLRGEELALAEAVIRVWEEWEGQNESA